jgi:hypothetical protein
VNCDSENLAGCILMDVFFLDGESFHALAKQSGRAYQLSISLTKKSLVEGTRTADQLTYHTTAKWQRQ